MDPRAPLKELTLAAASVADDLSFVALADVARCLDVEPPPDHRIIGGHMTTALVTRWGLGADLYRETGDTDLGVPPVVIRELGLVDRLLTLGYEKVGGCRFIRRVEDLPVSGNGTTDFRAVVDVLVPAASSRARQNRRVGSSLVTTEVPGLATALQRPPTAMTLHLRRLNGSVLDADMRFPDEPSALALKALATTVRSKDTDVVDLWRCLEVCDAAGRRPGDFADDEMAAAAEITRRLFADRTGPGMQAVGNRLSVDAADRRFTRIRALVGRVLGSG